MLVAEIPTAQAAVTDTMFVYVMIGVESGYFR